MKKILYTIFFLVGSGMLAYSVFAVDQVKSTDTLIYSSDVAVTSVQTAPINLYIGDNLSGVTNPLKSLYFIVSGVYTGVTGGTLKLDINGIISGALTPLDPPTIGSGALSSTSGVTVSPDGKSVYVANQPNANVISMYSRNTTTGVLTATSPATIPGGTNPIYVHVSPDGGYAYSSNNGGQVFMYSRSTTTSTLTALSPASISIETNSNAGDHVISPDGLALYVPDRNGNVAMFSRATSTGLLTALSPATIPAGGVGTTAFGINISPDGNFVYASNQDTGLVYMYSRASATGLLTALSPATIAAGTTPKEHTISPDGTSLYVTNSGSSNISMYSRNATTGLLTALSPSTISTGVTPIGITVSSDGTSVYVTNQTDNTVSIYFRDISTGVLTNLGTQAVGAGTTPTGVAVSPDGASVYVSNKLANSVSMYSRAVGTSQVFTLPAATVPTPFELIYKDPSNLINPTSAGAYTYSLNMTPAAVTIYGLAVKMAETHRFAPPACADGASTNQKTKTTDTFVYSSDIAVTTAQSAPINLYIGDNLAGVTSPIKSVYFVVSGLYTTGVNNATTTINIDSDAATSQAFILKAQTIPTPFEFIYKDPSNLINPTTAGAYTYTLNMIPEGMTIWGLAVKMAETHQYAPPSCGGMPILGDLISAVFDSTGTADGAGYNSVMWTGALGGPGADQGKVRFQFAGADSPAGPWSYIGGATCAVGDWFDTAAPSTPVELIGTGVNAGACRTAWNNKRYFRYKVEICSNDCTTAGTYTPTVNNVIVNWVP